MPTFKDWLDNISTSGAKEWDAAALTARTQALKARYVKNRDVILRLKDSGRAGLPAAVLAGLDALDLVRRELFPIARHPLTTASPIANEINSHLTKLNRKLYDTFYALPQAVPTRDPGASLGSVLKLFDTLDAVIVRGLGLLHREEAPDYFRGLNADAPYPSYRYSASNRGRVPAFSLPEPEQGFMRSFKIGSLIWPSCVIGADGSLYTGHSDGEFVALRPDGSVKWRIRDKQMMYIDSTGALGADGFLYMASTDSDSRGHHNQGRIWKIDPESGAVIWTFWGRHFDDPEKDARARLSSFFEGNLTINDEGGKLFVYAGCDDNRLYKIDAESGELAWEYNTESYPSGVIWTKPLLSPDGGTVYVGSLAGGMHAVDAASGTRRWMSTLGGAIVSSPACGMFGEIIFGCFDGNVYSLDPDDGSIFWSYQTLGLVYSSPAIDRDGSIVIGSSDGGVYRIDRFGKQVWTYFTDGPVKSSPAIDPEGLIYIGGESGKLYCLSPDGNRVWSLLTAPPPGNDLNSSPSPGPDGSIYIGSTTGDVFAVSRNYCRQHPEDPRVSTDPGHDGTRPDIPPHGATLVPLNRFGVPQFGPAARIGIADNFHIALLASDGDLNIIPAEIDHNSVKVEMTPDPGFTFRVDSMGRAIHVIVPGLLDYDTEYKMHVSGTCVAENGTRDFDRTLDFVTVRKTRGDRLRANITSEKTTGAIAGNFVLSRPKELDALAQPALDSQRFAVAPIYIDREKGLIVIAGFGLSESGGACVFSQKPMSKFIASGTFKDSWFKVSGSMQVAAQGLNTVFDLFRFGGRFTDEPGIEDGSFYASTSIHNMPDFVELLRVMRMADAKDELSAFLTFSAQPFDDPAARRPEGVAVALEADFDRVTARVSSGGYKADRHSIRFILIDTDSGELIGNNRVDVATDEDGCLTEVITTIPAETRKGASAAILVLDLFPVATLRI
ncbi:MAG: PQQ-binding-like beta-propeller repeat protein [bacterium]